MSLPYAAPKWTDGQYAIATPVSLPQFSAPIPGVKEKYLLEQRWQQFLNNYNSAGPIALGTAHPDYPNHKLVEEGPLEDIGGGVVQWTRKYCKVPATHNEWQTFAHQFVGMTIAFGTGAYQTRDPQNWVVTSRIQHDYFLVPSTGVTDPILGGDTFDITGAGDIPSIDPMFYVIQREVSGMLLGGLSLEINSLNVSGAAIPTWPTSEQYQTMMAQAEVSGWNSAASNVVLFTTTTSGHAALTVDTDSSTLGGQIPAEASRLDRWMGPIYVRRTRYVLAQ